MYCVILLYQGLFSVVRSTYTCDKKKISTEVFHGHYFEECLEDKRRNQQNPAKRMHFSQATLLPQVL